MFDLRQMLLGNYRSALNDAFTELYLSNSSHEPKDNREHDR